MAKSKTKRTLQGRQNDPPPKKAKTASSIITPPPDQLLPHPDVPKTLQSIGLLEDDIELAIDTLRTLSENPSIIKSKSCRDLRTAVYDFRQACTTGSNATSDNNLTARISGFLADGRYTEAQVLLSEMRIRKVSPKLGALCRWVRDLDVVSGLAEQLDGSSQRTSIEEALLKVLDSILRLTGPIDYATVDARAGPICPRPAWDLRGQSSRRQVYQSVLTGAVVSNLPTSTKSKFRIIEVTPGIQRKPANLHPAILYASADDAIPLDESPPKTSHHTHPIVPNLHLLKDVLSYEECTKIVAAAETMGFTPDAPMRAEGEDSSVLAHNFYWVVDNAFCSKIWERVRPFVPTTSGGKKVRGLNRRFRVYRYVPGAEYRAHIGKSFFPPCLLLLTCLGRWRMASFWD
jgi:hypothetical protein